MAGGNGSEAARRGRLRCGYALALCAFVVTMVARGEETATVVGHVDALSGDPEHYTIIRGTDASPPVRVRTQILQGDFMRIEDPGETVVIEFTDGSREKLGPVAGLYGPYVERGGETRVLSNLFAALVGTVSDFRARRTETVATAARGKGGPIVMGDLFTKYPLVLVAGRRTLFLRWGGGNAPYRVCVTRVEDDAVIIDADRVDTQHFRTKSIDLGVGDYVVEISTAESKFGFRFQVASVDNLPEDIAMPDLPVAVADYLNAYALAVAADNVWVFESYQRLTELVEQDYEPAGLLMQELEEGEARYWEIPAKTRGPETPSSGEAAAKPQSPALKGIRSATGLASKECFAPTPAIREPVLGAVHPNGEMVVVRDDKLSVSNRQEELRSVGQSSGAVC